jgi:hypothetical protein
MTRFIRICLRAQKEIKSIISYVNQMVFKRKHKNIFWTQLSKLRTCTGSAEMSATDIACIASFVKNRFRLSKVDRGTDTQTGR